MKTIIPLIVLTFSWGLLFWYINASYDSLPVKIASHFNAQGKANGWMNAKEEIQYTIAFASILPAIALLVLALLCRRILDHALWLGCLTALLATGIHWQIVQANIPNGVNGNGGVLGMACLISFVTWVVTLVYRVSMKTT